MISLLPWRAEHIYAPSGPRGAELGFWTKEPEPRLCSDTSVIEQVCVARESWCHLSECWPLACLRSFGDVGSFLAVLMKTKGSVGFHTVSERAAGGPACRRSWVLCSTLPMKEGGPVGDQTPDEKPQAGAKPWLPVFSRRDPKGRGQL